MSEDISRYKRLVENAHNTVMEEAPDYNKMVQDTANTVAHAYSQSPDKDAIRHGILGHAEHHDLPDPHKFAADVTKAVLDKIRTQH